jgi:putative tricarboxylic transport membrane protein
MKIEAKHTDKIGAVIWLVLAAGVFFLAGDLPTGTGETGPGFYPRVIAVLIAAFAVAQLVRSAYESNAEARVVTGAQVRKIATVTVLVTVYVLSLPWLGFVTGTVAFLVVGMVYSGAKSPLRIGGIAIGLSLTLYYVFAVFLRIPLPESPFVPVEALLPGLIATGGLI